MYGMTCPEEYMNRVKHLNELIDQEMKQRILNEKEEKSMVTQAEIDALFDKYKNASTFEDRQNYLLLMLYLKNAPLRLDWAECLVGDQQLSATENCFSLSDASIHLRKYKTAGTYGPKVIRVSDETNECIRSWLSYRKEQGIVSDYLLLNPSTHTMMSRVNLSKNLSKLFGKSVGCNILRKHYVSTHVDAGRVEAEEKLASSMCHSTAVQKSSYCKKLNTK
jgi:hypothetical protein